TYAAIPAVPEYEYRRRDAEQTLDRARELLEDFPGVSAVATVEGDSVGALAKITERAQTVIVGARGRGGFLGRVLGSVAAALPAHAKCPTIVIPGDEDEAEPLSALDLDPRPNEAPVFAGVDGSQLSRIAALAAAEIASEAETALSLVTALHPLDESILWYGGASAAIPEVTHQMRQELADHLDAEVAWVKRHFPDLQVEGSVRVGQPDQVLEEASHRGQLTVVGGRGRGGRRRAPLGSTPRSLLPHAAGCSAPASFRPRAHFSSTWQAPSWSCLRSPTPVWRTNRRPADGALDGCPIIIGRAPAQRGILTGGDVRPISEAPPIFIGVSGRKWGQAFASGVRGPPWIC